MTQVTGFCSCLSSSSLLPIPQIQSCPKLCLLVFPVLFPLRHMLLQSRNCADITKHLLCSWQWEVWGWMTIEDQWLPVQHGSGLSACSVRQALGLHRPELISCPICGVTWGYYFHVLFGKRS